MNANETPQGGVMDSKLTSHNKTNCVVMSCWPHNQWMTVESRHSTRPLKKKKKDEVKMTGENAFFLTVPHVMLTVLGSCHQHRVKYVSMVTPRDSALYDI